ncbi:xanthine dehydrogenase family protein molybdopterin-binding subunit [Candidatus Spongiisocius sp.]|uniref:xanthine dehydrogenase family protein molybdopterin-binding subunit n=1 Tax=Candidatus Spongiisocius sp. TaxID=3101273 RepID=UPI003B59FCC1
MTTRVRTGEVRGGVGESTSRSDGIPKTDGTYTYSSDLHMDRMLFGATLRCPHPKARITKLDIGPALAMTGVHAVLTGDDVPGRNAFGLETADQPILATDLVEYWGQAVALVAADDPEIARRAVEAIGIEYEVLEPLTDPEDADARDSVFHRARCRRGRQDASGAVVVEGYYEVGMQDQAPLGTESGLAIPDGRGGVDLHIATQWTHVDRDQIVAGLGVEEDAVRVHHAGVGGAFGAREDVSLQIHLCLLALYTGRPVKMEYSRAESFVGHVHRHPAQLWMRHEADHDGTLRRIEARIIIDGGAFRSTSDSVIGNAVYHAAGPYRCDSVSVDGVAVRTNNPPCGAMRGFGAVQACFGHEAQMDKLADALGMDRVEFRIKNALRRGDPLATSGQVIDTSAPVVEILERLRRMPLPPVNRSDDPRLLPGGTGLTTSRPMVTRGVGYAIGLKNLCFSAGFDDYSEARVAITPFGVEVHTAAVEVGQGLGMSCAQIARTVLGIEDVVVFYDDTSKIGSAGSTSASRQTQMTGGAVMEAARMAREIALRRGGGDELDGEGVWKDGILVTPMEDLVGRENIEYHTRFHHPETYAPDENGQGDLHVDFAFAAHRAVVDVDPELGLFRVVQVDTVQDVGFMINPRSVVGQIEGGTMQGIGLATLEEIVVENGVIQNPTFTDYLLPTFLDAPSIEIEVIEEPSSFGPFGAKGVGEPPTVSSTAAVVAAIRDATGLELNRTPVRPEHVALGDC